MRDSLHDYQAHVLLGQITAMCVPHVSSDYLPDTVLCTLKAFTIANITVLCHRYQYHPI